MDDFNKYQQEMEKEEALEREREKAYIAAFGRLLKDPDAAFVFRVILEKNQLFKSSFVSDSQRLTDFNEGQRTASLKLFNDIVAADPDAAGMIAINKIDN